ncbi:LAMI_0H10594g1_1 [Lachancea mirantina]|uniref:Succinate dehydrogenase assembly factor 4, mitochondrial n=1 Tax=Lachancea mirantina TaxID=1230905 RepID=A0A1G4KGW6_9SACH|nr:LAMI_0H10594g1_1 [Lachancea mirantina]
MTGSSVRYLSYTRSGVVGSSLARFPAHFVATAWQGWRGFNTKEAPGPPKLADEDQEEFERLQKVAMSQEAIEQYNASIENDTTKESANSPILKNDVGGFSPEFTRTLPEFSGDVNPKTGEKGGPKQDPLRYGDYSFNGRVTDF